MAIHSAPLRGEDCDEATYAAMAAVLGVDGGQGRSAFSEEGTVTALSLLMAIRPEAPVPLAPLRSVLHHTRLVQAPAL